MLIFVMTYQDRLNGGKNCRLREMYKGYQLIEELICVTQLYIIIETSTHLFCDSIDGAISSTVQIVNVYLTSNILVLVM